jgi:hypothetical protein
MKLTRATQFANALPLTHAERRRLQALTNKRILQRLTPDEMLERAALRFRLIGMEVN